MTTSHCMKQKKQTECVLGSEKIVTAKNGRLIMKCKCVECGITKTKFIKGQARGGEMAGEALGFFNKKRSSIYSKKECRNGKILWLRSSEK